MPWIKFIAEHEAGPELKEVYRKIREQRLGLEVADWQIQRARAGAEPAQKLAEERGVAMPKDL